MDAPEGDDLDAWPVYADWLQAQADPHERALGEAIITNTAEPSATHHAAWLGPLGGIEGCRFADWVGGFPRSATITVDGPRPGEVVAQVLAHRASRRISHLAIYSVYDTDGSIAGVIEVLVATRRPRGVVELEIRNGPNFGGPYRTYPVTIGDVSGLWRTFRLASLVLEGNELRLGEVEAPALRALRVDLAGREPLRRLAAAELGELEKLDLRLGVESYPAADDWRDVVDLLPPVLDPDRLVGLRHLVLRTRHDLTADLVALAPRAATLPRLGRLDLYTGSTTRELLEPHRGALAHLDVRVDGKPHKV